MLVNGRSLHSLVTELLAQAKTSQMESASLVPRENKYCYLMAQKWALHDII